MDREINVHFLPGNLIWLGEYAGVDFSGQSQG